MANINASSGDIYKLNYQNKKPATDPADNTIYFPKKYLERVNIISGINLNTINSGSELYNTLKEKNTLALELLKSIAWEQAKNINESHGDSNDKISEIIKKIYSCAVKISTELDKHLGRDQFSLKNDLMAFRRDCTIEMGLFF